jgi:hypothetical protein
MTLHSQRKLFVMIRSSHTGATVVLSEHARLHADGQNPSRTATISRAAILDSSIPAKDQNPVWVVVRCRIHQLCASIRDARREPLLVIPCELESSAKNLVNFGPIEKLEC